MILKLLPQAILLALCCMIPAILRGQSVPHDSLTARFDAYRSHVLQEKVYVHIDRTLYITGEVAWFKVYVTDGSFHRPLDVSKVAYVELLDNANQPVLQAKIGLTSGSGSGSFFLPATLRSGHYRLRAYTQWMRNFSAEYYFKQTLTLINPFTGGSPEVVTEAPAGYAVQFYPEGGHAVAGVNNAIAFRITDTSGTGANLEGLLVDDDGDTVATFTPKRFGIGRFNFIPQVGRHYTAVIKTPGTKSFVSSVFPEVKAAGYTLSLHDDGSEQLTLRIQRRGNVPLSTSMYLFAHARNIIVHSTKLVFVKDSIEVRIAKTDLPEGITHFTVFTEALQPVCERLYFRYPSYNTTLVATSDQAEYGIRRKVTLTLQATEHDKPLALPDVSVAVYREDSLAIHPRENIASYLWLTSDLTGTPDSAAYYLQEPTTDVITAMDNLMLTHGWRRFRWDDVLSRRYHMPYAPEYRGHIVRGRVANTAGLSNTGILSYLSWPGKLVRLHSARSNDHGEVRFEVKDFTGPHRLITQTDLRRDSLHRITIDDPFSNSFCTDKLSRFGMLPLRFEPALRKRSIAMQVNSIYHERSLNRYHNPYADSAAFYGMADETYMLDAYTRFPVMEEVMREYVPGVLVRKRRDGFHFLLLDDVNHAAFAEDPMILLDGVPVFKTDRIMSFDPRLVRKLEVVTRKYYLGPALFQGIVSYTTYTGDLNGFELDPKCVVLDYEGLQHQREFHTPLYETSRQRVSRLADQRFLLYWTPTVTAQADGSGKLTFYTSDVPGTYTVVIEGLTATGQPVSTRHTFLVKRFED